MLNNLILLAAVPFAILIPLLVAYLLNEHVFGWRFFRSAYFLPTAISWVVIGMVAIRFFAVEGILNDRCRRVGLGVQTDMLSGEYSAMLAVTITFIWSVFGTNTIIFITGMATLDREVYEAARVDGASGFTTFRKITIPMLMRFIQFAFILTLITAFTALFSLIFVMTGGGPGFGSTTLEFYVYQQGFKVGAFGYAAAIGIVLFVVVFAISIAQLAAVPQPAGLGAPMRSPRRRIARLAMFAILCGVVVVMLFPFAVHDRELIPVQGPVRGGQRLLARLVAAAVHRACRSSRSCWNSTIVTAGWRRCSS